MAQRNEAGLAEIDGQHTTLVSLIVRRSAYASKDYPKFSAIDESESVQFVNCKINNLLNIKLNNFFLANIIIVAGVT